MRCLGEQSVSVIYCCIISHPQTQCFKQQTFNLLVIMILWFSYLGGAQPGSSWFHLGPLTHLQPGGLTGGMTSNGLHTSGSWGWLASSPCASSRQAQTSSHGSKRVSAERASPSEWVLFEPQLVCLLMSRWPKKIIRPNSGGRGLY